MRKTQWDSKFIKQVNEKRYEGVNVWRKGRVNLGDANK